MNQAETDEEDQEGQDGRDHIKVVPGFYNVIAALTADVCVLVTRAGPTAYQLLGLPVHFAAMLLAKS